MQRTRTRTAVAIVAAVIIAVAAVGLVSLAGTIGEKDKSPPPSKASPPAATAGTVDVKLSDFKIGPSTAAAKAGKVTFVARNVGKTEHEMVVVRTDKPAGSLMKGSEASEAGAVDEIAEFEPGLTKRLTLRLKPGHYVLLCNVPGHYKAGMFADFTVR